MIYSGSHYKVTDAEIAPTGKIEVWVAESRQEAIEAAVYTHRLHNRRAYASPFGIIHCPSCGQIAITVSARHKREPGRER